MGCSLSEHLKVYVWSLALCVCVVFILFECCDNFVPILLLGSLEGCWSVNQQSGILKNYLNVIISIKYFCIFSKYCSWLSFYSYLAEWSPFDPQVFALAHLTTLMSNWTPFTYLMGRISAVKLLPKTFICLESPYHLIICVRCMIEFPAISGVPLGCSFLSLL